MAVDTAVFKLVQPYEGHAAGTHVYKYAAQDYGCARDCSNLTGEEHISVTLDPRGGWPILTVPVSLLQRCDPAIAATEEHAIEHVVNAVMGPRTIAAQLEILLSGMACAADVADVLMFFRKLGMLESDAKEAVRRLITKPVQG